MTSMHPEIGRRAGRPHRSSGRPRRPGRLCPCFSVDYLYYIGWELRSLAASFPGSQSSSLAGWSRRFAAQEQHPQKNTASSAPSASTAIRCPPSPPARSPPQRGASDVHVSQRDAVARRRGWRGIEQAGSQHRRLRHDDTARSGVPIVPPPIRGDRTRGRRSRRWRRPALLRDVGHRTDAVGRRRVSFAPAAPPAAAAAVRPVTVPVHPAAFIAVAVAVASMMKHRRLEGHERRERRQKVREDPPQLHAVNLVVGRAERRAEHGGAAQDGRGGGIDETGDRSCVATPRWIGPRWGSTGDDALGDGHALVIAGTMSTPPPTPDRTEHPPPDRAAQPSRRLSRDARGCKDRRVDAPSRRRRTVITGCPPR